MVMERMELDLFELMHRFQGYVRTRRIQLTSFNQLQKSRLPPRLCRRILYQIGKSGGVGQTALLSPPWHRPRPCPCLT
jgi:hypothetical protein